MIKKCVGCILVIAVGFILGCREGNTQPARGQKALDFTLPSIEGKEVTLSSFKGKRVLLDFFATWCPPCRQELMELNEIIQKYPQENYTILCISVDDSINKARTFITDKGYKMTVLFDDKNIANQYGVTGIPSLFLVDKEGNIEWSQAGALPKERLIALLGLDK